jgi:FkbM family methyltransferase
VKYRIAWRLGWPFRAYIRHSPIRRGKGLLIRRVVVPLLPPLPASFIASLPGGGRIELYFRETLGYVTLIYGGFESAELDSARSFARPGTTAFDVGSNVGMFAVVMARAVGAGGSVVAVEPDPANVQRLRTNLALNEATNVRIVEAAATNRDGSLLLHLAEDSAYHSLGTVMDGRTSNEAVAVEGLRLDRIWHDAGEPMVSLMKVDVEGAELPVLEGSEQILTNHHPTLIVEAGNDLALEALRAFLASFNYREQIRDKFMPWNHLFLWNPGQ